MAPTPILRTHLRYVFVSYNTLVIQNTYMQNLVNSLLTSHSVLARRFGISDIFFRVDSRMVALTLSGILQRVLFILFHRLLIGEEYVIL